MNGYIPEARWYDFHTVSTSANRYASQQLGRKKVKGGVVLLVRLLE